MGLQFMGSQRVGHDLVAKQQQLYLNNQNNIIFVSFSTAFHVISFPIGFLRKLAEGNRAGTIIFAIGSVKGLSGQINL